MRAGPISDLQAKRFKRLAWPLMPVVLRAAKYLAKNAATAEDLAQETMIKAMCAVDSYQDGTDMKAWLLTILRRTYIDRLRSEANRPNNLSLDVEGVDLPAGQTEVAGRYDEHWHDPEDLMDRFDDETIIDALRQLPDEIRWTILLVDVEQVEYAEAATILGVAEGTAKSRIHRGRALLRDRLYQIAAKRGWDFTKERSG